MRFKTTFAVTSLAVATFIAIPTLSAQTAANQPPSPTQLATLPVLSGTYNATLSSGPITYQATRLFYRIGSGGWVRVNGARYWGVMATSQGVTGLTWYYGSDSTGPEAGRAILTYDPITLTYTGPIQFTNRRGTVLDTGTVTLSAK